MPQDKPVAPSPSHRIRAHSSPVNVICFSSDNERICTGDSSGLVVVTSNRTLRSLACWKAHTDGLLGVQEWDGAMITHGRDNKLHVWRCIHEARMSLGDSAALPGLQTPSLLYSMDVNALNYCRFSLLPLSLSHRSEQRSGFIALPNLVESSLADVWVLPSQQRLHAAIGKYAWTGPGGRSGGKAGIIMTMHLFHSETDMLSILLGYEDGSVSLWRFSRTDKETSVEGVGWQSIWTNKLHLESVMAMAVTNDNSVALTVSADHVIGRYNLLTAETRGASIDTACVAHKTKSLGHSTIAIRDDGKVFATGGWDGKIRLYSTKTFKPLGTLHLHKNACQALAFAHPNYGRAADEEDEDMTAEEKEERTRWLVSGGRDCRIAVWSLMSFSKG